MRRWIILIAGAGALIFYRRRRLGGEVAARGPLILVCNHPNSIVDPVLVTSFVPRPLRFLAKAPLFRKRLLGTLLRWSGAVPVYRAMDGGDMSSNETMFSAVSEALGAGDAICLFPEGISHSEPSVQKLKTGAARMALQAERERGFGLGVRIQPVGLVYADKHKFKSKVALWVGEEIALDDLAELDARDNRAAVEQLTERVAQGLQDVTLNLDRWEDLPMIELAEKIYWSEGGNKVARLKALSRSLATLRDKAPRRMRRLERRMRAFDRVLKDLGLSPSNLRTRYSTSRVTLFVIRQLLAVCIGLPLAVVGMLAWLPPMVITRFALPFARVRHDVIAAFKIVVGSLLFVIWYALVVSGIYWYFGGVPALTAALAAPPLAFFAGYFWRNRTTAISEVLVFSKLASSSKLRQYLHTQRDELAAELDQLAAMLPTQERPVTSTA